jgi:D-glycero-alpha-D-manno-heptose-7-phosphate kinase
MKTLILAGGFGRRLEEVVKDVPKPMALIAGKPFLEHQINFLRDQGLEDLILAVHHKSGIIKSYFGEGIRLRVNITYSEEETPLGTAGAIKNAERYIENTFFVLNGDSYSDANLSGFQEFHKANNNLGSVLLTKVSESSHYGSVSLQGNQITSFSEKSQGKNGLVSGGIYLFEPELFNLISPGKKVSLENEILPELAASGRLGGFIHKGYFMDIGRPETYYQFKKDFLKKMQSKGNLTIREAMQIIERNRTDLLFVVDESQKFLGILNDGIIRRFLIGGGNLDEKVSEVMVKEPEIIGKFGDNEDKILKLLESGTRHVPILDENRRIYDVRFRNEETSKQTFPIVRGKSPLRISFAGGGTDIPNFFEKYGGAVISSTIDKYCHATAGKRADSKIVIESDMVDGEVVLDSRNLEYDGRFDIIKSVFNIIKPGFGVDFYLHNDVSPGRGLGSSASFAVLITKILGRLQGKEYDDQTLAEIAYMAEVEELRIGGGKQDQYASVFGGFNWIEFGNGDKKIIHPLRLKEDTIDELRSHLTLCYTGLTHQSGEQHQSQKTDYQENEREFVDRLQKLKDISSQIKENLLLAKPNFERIGDLLHESWKTKRKIARVSSPKIDNLYETGLRNGSYGGKLLGSGGGGYLLFFHPPKRRNQLIRTLQDNGGEILDFNFESQGARVWTTDIR